MSVHHSLTPPSPASVLRYAAIGLALSSAVQARLAHDLQDEFDQGVRDERIGSLIDAASHGAIGSLHDGTLQSIIQYQGMLRGVADVIDQSQREGRTDSPTPTARPH